MIPAFEHRMLLGWINDVSTQPRAGGRWPIIDVDDQLLRDYAELFAVARDWGYNGITIWGLYVDHAWPVNLADCIVPARRKIIDRILAAARDCGITVYSGLGVYTWGFEQIIRAHPEVARNEGRRCWGRFVADNGVAMCYHQPAAREWMQRIIDFTVREMGVEGLGLQSADQGRCYCAQCRELGDMEYHALVIAETAAYTRQRLPQVKLSFSGWGVNLNRDEDLPHLQAMGRDLDFMTDVSDSAARRGGDYRRRLAEQLPCALGSLGQTVVVPPQRWVRDRWFLPHAELTGRRIAELAADGGRAFEFFAGPLANPQFDLMTRFVGRLLSKPREPVEPALAGAVDAVLQPGTATVRDGLVRWLLDVERAYFGRIEAVHGQFDFEPLMGVDAGPPIYLDRLGAVLGDFERDLHALRQQFQTLTGDCAQHNKAGLIDRCMANMQADIRWRMANPKA